MGTKLENNIIPFSQIPNNILDRKRTMGFSGAEHDIIECILRYTYGYRDVDGIQRDSWELSHSFIAEATKHNRVTVANLLDRLVQRNVIIVAEKSDRVHGQKLKVNENTDEWVPAKKLPHKRGSIKATTGDSQEVSTCANQTTNSSGSQKAKERNRNLNKYLNNNINKRTAFIPPNLKEVQAYCEKRKNGIDAQQWYDYYTSVGWVIGKAPMKDWEASIRTWERNIKNKQDVKNGKVKEKEVSFDVALAEKRARENLVDFGKKKRKKEKS